MANRKIPTIAIVSLMLFLSLAGLTISGPVGRVEDSGVNLPLEFNYYQKYSGKRLDPYLDQKLSEVSATEELEIIVQFYDEVKHEDRQFLSYLGVQIEREFTVIPAIYALAPRGAVLALSEYERTYWIEYNEQLEYLMDETTTSTNATKVWDSYITDLTGKYADPIDGEGITVVVVDSGIDAGHPDLDYGEKVILNYKSDLDGAYTSVENSDTSSGHGTHCAGTIGGNGDASAGSRRGVAPECKMIGISTGEAVAILNALGALQWVYDNSRPNANPYNIKVVSNSWGTNAPYNPEDSIVKVCEKLTYENNVAVVFAAGNEGAENHDGSDVTTNPYSLTPPVISVAAMIKDGSGLAYFSSRGTVNDNFTWPDIGAPGYIIWATEARKTLITAMVKQGNQQDAIDGYYMAISGTSMATPHVSGLAALMFQAAPSLKVSSIHDDYSGNGDYQNTEYWNSSNTLIHEVELIMKLTARYVDPDELPLNSEGDNGVPDNYSIGINHQPNDYAQGYGFIDAEKAIGLCLTLENLRYKNPQATVWDAMYSYMDTIRSENLTAETNVLTTQWTGEWSYLNDGRESTLFTVHPKYVYVPNETSTLILDLSFDPVNIPERQAGTISLTIDYDNDGNIDWQSDLSFTGSLNGQKHDEIALSGGMESHRGKLWTFNVIGQVLSWPLDDMISTSPLLVGEKDFREGLIEYRVSFQAVLDLGENGTVTVPFKDLHARVGQLKFGEPTSEYTSGSIQMNTYVYNMTYARMPEEILPEPSKSDDFPWWILALILLILILIGAWWYMRNKAGKPLVPERLNKIKKNEGMEKPQEPQVVEPEPE
jgi:serine protease AprX